MKNRLGIAVGVLSGFGFAAASVGLAGLNGGRSDVLDAVRNFFAAVPVLLAWTPGLPQAMAYAAESGLRIQRLISAVILICVLYGCATAAGQIDGTESRYFTSPEQAVTVITELLRREDWPTLSRYYELSDSKVDREELESGRFFIRAEKPEGAHPAGFWRYKHPFAPGFKFDRVNATADPSVIVVMVTVEIDQGGGVKQRGLSEFKMRRSTKGYQILPPSDR